MAKLSGRTALVTGAAMGIGRATALALAREGAAVVVADIDDATGAAVVAEIVALGGSAVYCHADVSITADVAAAVALAVERFGGLNILVNNAAQAIGGSVTDMDEATWNRVLDLNLTSVWRGMKYAIPIMIATCGFFNSAADLPEDGLSVEAWVLEAGTVLAFVAGALAAALGWAACFTGFATGFDAGFAAALGTGFEAGRETGLAGGWTDFLDF